MSTPPAEDAEGQAVMAVACACWVGSVSSSLCLSLFLGHAPTPQVDKYIRKLDTDIRKLEVELTEKTTGVEDELTKSSRKSMRLLSFRSWLLLSAFRFLIVLKEKKGGVGKAWFLAWAYSLPTRWRCMVRLGSSPLSVLSCIKRKSAPCGGWVLRHCPTRPLIVSSRTYLQQPCAHTEKRKSGKHTKAPAEDAAMPVAVCVRACVAILINARGRLVLHSPRLLV